MERKNTLLVFTLSSILVLAGFAAGEKAYARVVPQDGLGDFYCFENRFPLDTPLGSAFEIQDQFATVTNNQWEQMEYCTAADKAFPTVEHVSPFDDGFPSIVLGRPLDQHYQGYLYPQGFPGAPGVLGTFVILEVPQFNQQFQTTIDAYHSVLFPATKFNPNPTPSQNTEHHWNCYDITGPIVGKTVNVITQHGFSQEVILDPFLMCAPMIKDGLFFPDDFAANGLDGSHMVCYNVSPRDRSQIFASEPPPTRLEDQVGNLPFFFKDVNKFCAPALKSFPIAVGGSMIPIDKTALLLAGVQSISMWMIPVVIAGIGIGVFVIKRRN